MPTFYEDYWENEEDDKCEYVPIQRDTVNGTLFYECPRCDQRLYIPQEYRGTGRLKEREEIIFTCAHCANKLYITWDGAGLHCSETPEETEPDEDCLERTEYIEESEKVAEEGNKIEDELEEIEYENDERDEIEYENDEDNEKRKKEILTKNEELNERLKNVLDGYKERIDGMERNENYDNLLELHNQAINLFEEEKYRFALDAAKKIKAALKEKGNDKKQGNTDAEVKCGAETMEENIKKENDEIDEIEFEI